VDETRERVVLIRVLGPVDVVDDHGTVHASTSALRRTLLALFAIHAGQVLSPDWLLEHAWNGEVPASELRALRFHISQLRRELGQLDLVETCPGGYRLRVNAGEVDVGMVESLARAARDETDDLRAARLCAEALAAWRGEPFIDASPTSDLADEAARLDELRLTLTELAYRRRLDAGEDAELVAELVRLTGDHPLREALWQVLIAAQYRAGRQADALRSYETLRSILIETLGSIRRPSCGSSNDACFTRIRH
jgi:DNA-binding SARP family transcriptional activator